jgi:hypothetical protein
MYPLVIDDGDDAILGHASRQWELTLEEVSSTDEQQGMSEQGHATLQAISNLQWQDSWKTHQPLRRIYQEQQRQWQAQLHAHYPKELQEQYQQQYHQQYHQQYQHYQNYKQHYHPQQEQPQAQRINHRKERSSD